MMEHLLQKYSEYQPNGHYYCLSFALHKPSKRLFVGSYNTVGIVVYDYTDIENVTKTIITSTTTDYGIPTNNFGASLNNGLSVVGDYLYMSPYSTTTPKVVYRVNITDNYKKDNLSTVNTYHNNFGSRGNFTYIEEQDRLFICSTYNGSLTLIENASNSSLDPINPAKAYYIAPDSSAYDDYYNGSVVWMKSQGANVYLVGGKYAF